MEVRQLLTVAIFMLAAVVMKSALPESLQSHDQGGGQQAVNYQQTVALVPANVFQDMSLSQLPSSVSQVASADTAAEAGNPVPIPGSMIALVVAALSLVSVARRTTN
ncbi:MAG: hypothetical protein KDJ38_12580 [Gammaproteobacteria bacterium]|nr:hypothetical protein [Gammaproteobacteria bacterium]